MDLRAHEACRRTVRRRYAFVLGDRFLHETNVSTYPPQPANKAGEVHEHWSFFSYDRSRKALVLRQFHQPQHVQADEAAAVSAARLTALCWGLVALGSGAADAQTTTGTSPAGIFYEASGTGEAVVLIHAFSVDRRMWAPQIAALEGRFRVVRYDLRGHGRSEGPLAPYAAHDDLRSVLDASGIDRATLIGLSAGATVATDFALAYPKRVVRLVLASPGLSGHVPATSLTWMQPVFAAAGAGDAEKAARLWLDTPIMALRNDLTVAPTVTDLVMGNVRLWTYKSNPARQLTPAAAGRLAEISCPALVILGGEDLPHVKEVARLIVDGIAGATLVTIPRAGHLVNLDASGPFNQAVVSFLAR